MKTGTNSRCECCPRFSEFSESLRKFGGYWSGPTFVARDPLEEFERLYQVGHSAAEWTADHVTGPYRFEVLRGVSHWIPETAPAELKLIKPGANPWYEVRIAEGRQNQIRIMFKYFGRLVEKLRRVKIAFLELDLPPGRWRALTPKEVERFRKLLKLE